MRGASSAAVPGAVVVTAAVFVLLLLLPGPVASSHTASGLASSARSAPAMVPMVPGLAPRAPALGGATARMIVTTNDTAAVPNDGVATNLTAYPPEPLPANSSFQTGAEEVIGSYDAVFGLFSNSETEPVAFFEVFSNTTDQVVRLEYWVGLPIVPSAPYDFRLQESVGTVWTLDVDGNPFGGNATNSRFDFGAAAASWGGGIGFSEIAVYATTSSVPPSYVATTALYVHHPGGGWYLPTEGKVAYQGPSTSAWGVEGRASLPDLAPGEVESGTVLSPVSGTAPLWAGGPVAVNVGVALAAPTVVGLAAVGVNAYVSSSSGAALAGVPVYVHDALGGSATPSTIVTGTAGNGATLLLAPNVSADAIDSVVGNVTILGYVGAASAALQITPAAHIVVVPDSSSLRVTPGGVASLTFRTLDGAGRPTADVALSFVAVVYSTAATTAGATLLPTPTAGTTDANGTLTIEVDAPTVLGQYGLFANVTSLGVWGHATVAVSVQPVAPSFWQRYGTLVLEGAGGAAVVVVAVLVVVRGRRRRRERAPLPSMDLRSMRLTPSEDPTVSRTPPSGGTP